MRVYPTQGDLVEALKLVNTAALEMDRVKFQEVNDLEAVYTILTGLNKRVEQYELERNRLFSALEQAETEAQYYLEHLKAAEEELSQLKAAVSKYISAVR